MARADLAGARVIYNCSRRALNTLEMYLYAEKIAHAEKCGGTAARKPDGGEEIISDA